MKIKVVDTLSEFKAVLGLQSDGVLLEPDLDFIENETDIHGRKRRDAEVLSTLAANGAGKCLDIGTSHGRSAYKLATNFQNGRVYTVNLLPEQYDPRGTKPTHLLVQNDIGIYFRERAIQNIEQIYANTLEWDIPGEISELWLAFIDGDHSYEVVYSDTVKVYDRVREGGFICWHDFSPFFRQRYDWIDMVMRAVERFFDEREIETEIVHLRNSWIGVLQKAAGGERQPARPNRCANPATAQAQASGSPRPVETARFWLVYPEVSAARARDEQSWAERLRAWGYQVKTFGIPCPDGWWPFPRLDAQWKQQSPELMRPYDALSSLVRPGDVLVASGGSMLHPEFITQLPTYNVFVCADDPESSEILSRPAAPAFDYSFPINIACVDQYRAWGCRRVNWIFPPIREELCDPSLTEEAILEGERDLDIFMLCERVSNFSDRAQRIERLLQVFPQAEVHGRGWPGGYVLSNEYYRRAKIGWNLHHTIGPTNTRTTTLPAFGVMQICDNKQHLGQLFRLGEEVVGFDSIDEAIEHTRYYLAHDRERREIAARGWKRAMNCYTEKSWWQYLLANINPSYQEKMSSGRAPGSNGRDAIELAATEPRPSADLNIGQHHTGGKKPRILILADRPGWAYDHSAQSLARALSDEFEFRIEYVSQQPDLTAWPLDLIYVMFWGETYHQRFVNDPRRVLKEVASHRWALEDAYGRLSPGQMVKRYLSDAGTVVAVSKRLQQVLSPYREVAFAPNGFEPGLFNNQERRSGALKIGWAGNANDPCKGLDEILEPASGQEFTIFTAGGQLNRAEMANYYNQVDALCVASTAEGEPLTLVEGLACGCYPICVDVGIVPELVEHRRNGLIVERRPAAFRAAFQWAATNVEHIRSIGKGNAGRMLSLRSWTVTKEAWRQVFRDALRELPGAGPAPCTDVHEDPAPGRIWEQNLGENLLEWPERAHAAAQAFQRIPLRPGDRVIDLGCGKQTVRRLLPADLHYIPVDRLPRTPDTLVMDLNRDFPEGFYRVAVILGLIEYLEDAPTLLAWASKHTDFAIFSLNDCQDVEKQRRQHWTSQMTFERLETCLADLQGVILQKVALGTSERLYLVGFTGPEGGHTELKSPGLTVQTRKLALFSAAVNGDNSGDTLIEDAVRRLLAPNLMQVFPLLQPLTGKELEQVNACDAAVICGTNLYQHIFACALTPQAIQQIQVPIIPLGIGSSASIGNLPRMNPEGVQVVRLLHDRCAVSSVRDPASLAFVNSLGIRNVELTGCPVLFHALQEPKFEDPGLGDYYLSVRKRLLHVSDRYEGKALKTLQAICRLFRPILVLQSPYDLPIAQELSERFGLSIVWDSSCSHLPLVEAAKAARRTVGFRLHFGMLSLSYGKPSTLIATDTRVSEFCNMMGLSYHNIQTYSDENLLNELLTPAGSMDDFRARWRELRAAMAQTLAANGLPHVL